MDDQGVARHSRSGFPAKMARMHFIVNKTNQSELMQQNVYVLVGKWNKESENASTSTLQYSRTTTPPPEQLSSFVSLRYQRAMRATFEVRRAILT